MPYYSHCRFSKTMILLLFQLRFNPLTSDGAYDILKFIFDCPTSGITLLDLGVWFMRQNTDLQFYRAIYEPRHEKTCLRGLRPGQTQTSLLRN